MTDERHSINPETIHNPFGNYSHGIFNPKSGLLVTSGQLGIYKNGKIPKSLLEQTNLCFENIQAILKDVELDLTHVLRVSAFLTKRDHFSDMVSDFLACSYVINIGWLGQTLFKRLQFDRN